MAVDLCIDRRPGVKELVDDVESLVTDAARSAQARSNSDTSFRSYAERSPMPAASMIDCGRAPATTSRSTTSG
jgi:hypothetical protein